MSERHFGDNWLDRTYRLLAHGDAEAAMEVLYREFRNEGLRPPDAERRLANLIRPITKPSSHQEGAHVQSQ